MDRMMDGEEQSAFSWWLRTGRLPRVRDADGVELKFNPWHDPANGRFTFSGTGSRNGGGGDPRIKRAGHSPQMVGHGRGHQRKNAVILSGGASRATGRIPPGKAIGTLRTSAAAPASGAPAVPKRDRSHVATEFVAGVGEGLYGVADGAVRGTYALLTTNPVVTVRETGRGIAGMIDKVIAAEDTPARIQVARAADVVAHASARDIGRATGTTVGNVALAVVPGSAAAKVSAMRHLRTLRPRPVFDPPQIGWAKETLPPDKPWALYNDTATGARPGRAPTLMRTMPDGSKRPVKFDGIEGDYVIDRKWSVSGRSNAVAQLKRQSQVLAEHRLSGTWEVPNEKQLKAARRQFKRHNVRNIKVRVVRP
ncbi:hypothetical protein [Sphingomonas adhaesiva]|uniref:hypothetical protein n=1 Tax=Sphingomonas adhaesiva TaxID=28212 RepID=UPI002FFAE049